MKEHPFKKGDKVGWNPIDPRPKGWSPHPRTYHGDGPFIVESVYKWWPRGGEVCFLVTLESHPGHSYGAPYFVEVA